MICDSQEQKNFILDCVRKYPTNYETALNCANAFGQSIQDAQVIAIKDQAEKFPAKKSIAPTPPPNPDSTKPEAKAGAPVTGSNGKDGAAQVGEPEGQDG